MLVACSGGIRFSSGIFLHSAGLSKVQIVSDSYHAGIYGCAMFMAVFTPKKFGDLSLTKRGSADGEQVAVSV